MPSGARLVLAVALLALGGAGGYAASSSHSAALMDRASATAVDDIGLVWKQLERQAKDEADAIAKSASGLATKDGINQLIKESAGPDDKELANTFADLANESWVQAVADGATSTLIVHGVSVWSQEPRIAGPATKLAEKAAVGVPAAALEVVDGELWLLGAAKTTTDTRQNFSAFIILARPFSVSKLVPADASTAATLTMRSTGRVVGSLGPDDALATLDKFKRSKRQADFPCCAARELVPGVELAVFADTSALRRGANGEARRGLIPRLGGGLGAGLLAAVLALFLGKRTPKDDERDRLLQETQHQLRQSQEVLQKLSTGAFATQAAAGASRSGPEADVGFASTQASVAVSRYEVVAPLGEGGMAKVSVAFVRGAEGFKRTFVLKRLKSEHASNQELVNQFIDEARLGASLVHSNIVPIFDFGRDAEGYFLAQEYILGRNVDALIEAHVKAHGKGLAPAVVAAIGHEALKALSYAHTRTSDSGEFAGLVHRDVSPANLMISKRGEVKLLDFGIVKSADRVTQTQAGIVKGNLFFMSPEQARALAVDPRSDLFSLGMVMATALVGRPLYSGDNMYDLMTRAAAGPTAADLEVMSAAAGPLKTFLLKALAIDPELRFQSASLMSSALASVMAPVPSVELEGLMTEFFKDELDAERQRFSGAA